MREIYTISPFSLSILEDCLRCFWLHTKKKILRPRGMFPTLPQGMDGVFKRYFDSYRIKKEIPPEIEGKIKNAKLFPEMEILRKWRNALSGLKVEYDKLGIKLRGAIDDLLIINNKSFAALDFKTKGFPAKENAELHYQQQLNLYTLLLEENGMKTAPYAYLLFCNPVSYADNKVLFNTKLVKVEVSTDDARKAVNKAAKILRGDVPNASLECIYCNWTKNTALLL